MPKISHLLAGAAVAAAIAAPLVVSAHGMPHGTANGKNLTHQFPFFKHMTLGTVTAINGTNLSVTEKSGTALTIDASKATFMGGFLGSAVTIADIQVGDKLMVNGPMTGTTVAATVIHDASLAGRNVFNGSVTAINGTTITINGRNNTTYTVDASKAKLTKGFRNGTTITMADIKVGDMITVNGTLSSGTISATAVNDNGVPKAFGEKRGAFRGHRQMMKK